MCENLASQKYLRLQYLFVDNDYTKRVSVGGCVFILIWFVFCHIEIGLLILLQQNKNQCCTGNCFSVYNLNQFNFRDRHQWWKPALHHSLKFALEALYLDGFQCTTHHKYLLIQFILKRIK